MSEITKEKLTSRKLWFSVIIAAIVTFGKQLGIDLDPEQLYALVGLAGAYNVGNGLSKGK